MEINKIYLGDCLEVMRDIPDKSIDMILCDLPYGTTHCKWDTIIPLEPLWEQYKRIIKDNGAIVLFSSQPFTSILVSSNIKNFKYNWFWIKDNKGNYLNAKIQPLRQVEEINIFNKHKYIPQGVVSCNKSAKRGSGAKTTLVNYKSKYITDKTGYPSNILYFGLDRNGIHPTQKPVALFEYLIKTYTNEGDLVLDNCAGSGTTGVACRNLNRNYILIEKEQEYIDVINKRLAQQTLI